MKSIPHISGVCSFVVGTKRKNIELGMLCYFLLSFCVHHFRLPFIYEDVTAIENPQN